MSGVPAQSERAPGLVKASDDLLAGYQAFLASPAFQHSIDIAVLVKVAGDESQPIKERRRAAEMLAKLRLEAMKMLSELLGTREMNLEALGIQRSAPAVALTQVNQKIEIVRATDWRSAAPLEDGGVTEVEALPAPSDPPPPKAGPRAQDPAP